MSTNKFNDNWPAPNEILLELGRMTTLWGTLESAVDVTISKLAGYESPLDVRAFILVAQSNFQQRVDIISTLCEQLSKDFPNLTGYEKVIKKIQSAQKSRNKYAHNAIITNPETGNTEVAYASARGALKINMEIVRVNDIRETIAKIHEATCMLHTLVTGKEMRPIWERNV